MTVSVNGRGLVVCCLYLLVHGIRFRKVPILYFIYGNSGNAYRTLFAQDRNGSFQVLRIGEHRYVHRPQGAVSPLERRNTRVLDFYIARERSSVGETAPWGL